MKTQIHKNGILNNVQVGRQEKKKKQYKQKTKKKVTTSFKNVE